MNNVNNRLELDNAGDRWVMPQQFGDCGSHQPVQLRRRIAQAQLVQNRNRVHHVADGRQLDQKNLAKIATREIGRGQDQNNSLSEDIGAYLGTPKLAQLVTGFSVMR